MRQIIYADHFNEYWRVFILSDGVRKECSYFKSAKSALRYAFLLKKKTGLSIAAKAYKLLYDNRETVADAKTEEQTVAVQEEKKEQPTEKPRKKTTKKNPKVKMTVG